MSSEAETSLNIQKLLDPSRADNQAVPFSIGGSSAPRSIFTPNPVLIARGASDPPGAISGP
jgi:hypothetical protein